MKRILLFEEDREGRETLARVLKNRGFAVVQAGDSEEALRSLASVLPLDLVISGTTGQDRAGFLADLRGERPGLPVIFLTDYCAPESRLRGIVHGAFVMSRALHFYINTRPVAMNELDRVIRLILHRSPESAKRPLAA